MKKYLVFLISFVLIYFGFQIISGIVLTASYTPDFSSLGGAVYNEIGFGETLKISFWITLLSATLAYFLSQKLFRNSTN